MERDQSTSARVARGLAFIREHGEALNLDLNRVKWDEVTMTNGEECVLAQASGRTYLSTIDHFMEHVDIDDGLDWDDWARDHGFLSLYAWPYVEEREDDYIALLAEWRAQVGK